MDTFTISSILRNFDGDPNIVSIVTSADLATITTAGYWTDEQTNVEALNNGVFQWASTDIVLISYAPDFLVNWFVFDATNQTFIANPAAGGLSNTLPSGDIFVGNGSNIAQARAMSGDATLSNTGVLTLANNAVTSAKTAKNLLQYVAVPLTAAQFKALYDTPIQLVAAGGANTLIVVERAVLAMTFVSAQYTAGGAVALQYDSTVHGAGVLASATIAAATINADAASASNMMQGVLADGPFSTTVNKGLYISNDTADFATGDSTFVVHAWYRIIPTV